MLALWILVFRAELALWLLSLMTSCPPHTHTQFVIKVIITLGINMDFCGNCVSVAFQNSM